jgi:hypothetical protein
VNQRIGTDTVRGRERYRVGVQTVGELQELVEPVEAAAGRVERAYANHESDIELGPYAALLAVYSTLVVGFGVWYRRSGRRLPRRVPAADVLLLGVATFRTSRLLTRDRVTAVVRAPFTRYEGPGKGQEVLEEPRGRGLRRAVGQLIACPFCFAQWIGTALVCLELVAPRLARVVTATMTAVTVSDGLQYAHTALQQRFE